MDEPMIISVAGSQDALWEADEFWDSKVSSKGSFQEEKTSQGDPLSGGDIKREPSLESRLRLESSCLGRNNIKVEPQVLDENNIKTGHEEKFSPESKVLDVRIKTEPCHLNCSIKTEPSPLESSMKTEVFPLETKGTKSVTLCFDQNGAKAVSSFLDSNGLKPSFEKDAKPESFEFNKDNLKDGTSFFGYSKKMESPPLFCNDRKLDDEIGLNGAILDDSDQPQHDVLREKDFSIVDVAFVCGICKNRFESEDQCKKHMQAEHDDQPFEEKPPPKPSLKSYRFRPSNDELKRKLDNPSSTVPEKSFCPGDSTPNDLKPDIRTFTVRPPNMTQVLCPTCGARFFHQKTLSRHLQNQHGVRENIATVTFTALLYACDFCGAKFSRYRTMLDHYKSEHSTIEMAPIDMPCLTCDEMFKTYKQLEEHVGSLEHSLHWYCFLCEQTFTKDLDFRNHDCPQSSKEEIVQDLKQSRLICETCCKIYFGPKLFSKHISRCKIKETCKDCGDEFTKLKDWFSHKLNCADIQVVEVHPAKS